MTEWLIRKFISKPEMTDDPSIRTEYGTLSSMTGIFCNILLFLVKLTIALLAGSVSVLSDAFNNLSDCLSCLISLFGYKLAEKPADREHPFGHGRMEYIASFLIAMIILFAAFELFTSSVSRIMNPSEITFSLPMALALLLSVGIKLWMSVFYKKTGTLIGSVALMASSADSRNDTFSTGLTLAAMLLSLSGVSFPFDGAAGVIISFLIFKSGYDIAKDIVDRLLGRPAGADLSESIRTQILSHPEILGVHDMIIHDYGPGVQIGSAHAEVDSEMTLMKAHEVIDRAEKEIMEKYRVSLTIHADPVERNNRQAETYRKAVTDALSSLDSSLSMHDLRLLNTEGEQKVEFDVLIPFGCKCDQKEILDTVNKTLQPYSAKAEVTFDHDFTESVKDE